MLLLQIFFWSKNPKKNVSTLFLEQQIRESELFLKTNSRNNNTISQ